MCLMDVIHEQIIIMLINGFPKLHASYVCSDFLKRLTVTIVNLFSYADITVVQK